MRAGSRRRPTAFAILTGKAVVLGLEVAAQDAEVGDGPGAADADGLRVDFGSGGRGSNCRGGILLFVHVGNHDVERTRSESPIDVTGAVVGLVTNLAEAPQCTDLEAGKGVAIRL